MAERIIMPKAGMAMETGSIIRWLKNIGDPVAYGEPILEIETDKTSMEVEAMNDGYLIAKLYDAGDEVPVVTTIGWIGEKDEKPAKDESAQPEKQEKSSPAGNAPILSAAPPVLSTSGKVLASPKARRIAREKGLDLAALFHGTPIHAADVERAAASGPKATPLAKRIADQRGLSLEGIQGSGHRGKIFTRDLPAAQGGHPAASQMPASEETVPMNAMRRTIARRMLQSHTEIPPVTLNTEANVTFLAEFRSKLNAGREARISYNDLVIWVCGRALKEFPNVNVSYSDQGVIRKPDINIGMAVAIDDGLIVPVVRKADQMTLPDLSATLKELAKRARAGGLKPDEYTGGTFTVSNLGMFGITSFTPIINLPEVAILGVCAITDRLALREGSVVTEKWMGLSLTFDHRVLDGASGAQFLERIRQLLENPMDMLL